MIGYVFKTQPSEIWEMTIDELMFWVDGCNQISEWKK